MRFIRKLFNRRKLAVIIAAIAVTIAVGSGGYAITNSGSNGGASGITNTPNDSASGSPNMSKVIPFQRGQPSPATQVGQIPAGFKDGDGTLITGAAADNATAAAAAAYAGGTINRVSQLSDGEYNVHIIGVNWPHHVFVSTDFKVVGAL